MGALGLDRPGTLGCGHDQRGGKELGAIGLDLPDHFLEGGGGGKIGTGADLCHKLVDLWFEVFPLDDIAGMVESLALAGWGDDAILSGHTAGRASNDSDPEASRANFSRAGPGAKHHAAPWIIDVRWI